MSLYAKKRIRPGVRISRSSPLSKLASAEPLLTVAEERGLVAARDRGDLDARDRLIRANLSLVLSIAAGCLPFAGALDLEDLFQAGAAGLVVAADRYDPTVGTKFGTYATWWIRQGVLQAVRRRTLVHLPEDVVRLLVRFHAARRLLVGKSGVLPTYGDVLSAMGLDDGERRTLARGLTVRHACDASESIEGGVIDWLADEPSDPETGMSVPNRWTDQLLGELTDRERLVVERRYGLREGTEPVTLRCVAGELALSKERVRQIQEHALRRMRAAADRLGLDRVEVRA